MGNTRIKICGVTRPDDARAAAAAGADAVGLVFDSRSDRALDVEAAAAVIGALPPFVAAVGLFLDPDAETVENVLERVALDLLQFHGSESARFCSAFGRPYIKAAAMARGGDPAATAEEHPLARGILADSHAPGEPGGSGATFAWDRLPAERNYNLILAGGLSAENVAEAVRQVRPAAVDVSSGVERARGVKDAARIQRFIEEVRRGDRSEA